MKETKPTAKAAKTVASMSVAAIIGVGRSQVVALEVGLEPGGVGAGRGGIAGPPAAAAAPAAAPADDGEPDPAEREQDRHRRNGVDEHVAEVVVSALVARQGEHALAELGHERPLDLLLGA